MKFLIRCKVLAFGIFLLSAHDASAIVFEVTTAEEFQAALATAASTDSEDQIWLSPGRYLGPFQVAFDNRKTLKISSKNTDEEVILSGESEIFILSLDGGDNEVNIILENLKFESGNNPSYGGAISFRSQVHQISSLYVENVSFQNNTAKRGGAIYAKKGNVFVKDSQFVDNTATEERSTYAGGAAIYVESGALSVAKSSFEDNNAASTEHGGIIFTRGMLSSLGLDGCSFFRNEGNLVTAMVSESVSIVNSTVQHTSDAILWTLDTKAIVLESNDFYCLDCNEMLSLSQRFGSQAAEEIQLSKNKFQGSGIINLHFFDEYLVGPKMTVEGNEFSFVAGAEGTSEIKLAGYKSLDFVNNTVFEGFVNLSPDLNAGQYTSLVNNIFSNSLSVINQVTLEAFTKSDEISHNLIQSFSKGWDSQKSNSLSEPIFASIEQLDFKLVSGSPGINAGNNDAVKDEEATDRDGSPRIVDGTVDIGAYERSTTALHPADTNSNNSISQDEFEAYNAAWRTNEAWPIAPAAIPVDFVTRAGFLLQKGGAYKNIGVGKPQTWVPLSD